MDITIVLYICTLKCMIFDRYTLFSRTWKSSKLADEMINQLEEHGLQMAKQKQDYFGNPP